MIAGNVTLAQIESAALQAGVRLVNVRPQGRRWAFTLGLLGELWRRLGCTGRRIAYVCFHGHARFMQELFALEPAALIITKLERYDGVEQFQRLACEVGQTNIGNAHAPLELEQACGCTGDQAAAMV